VPLILTSAIIMMVGHVAPAFRPGVFTRIHGIAGALLANSLLDTSLLYISYSSCKNSFAAKEIGFKGHCGIINNGMLTTNETFPVKSNEALMIYFILYVCYCLLIGAILWRRFP